MTVETKYGRAEVSSPFEVYTYFIELPPVKGDHIEGAVRFRLRSLHPGDPLATKVDIRSAAIRTASTRATSVTPAATVTRTTSVPRAAGSRYTKENALRVIAHVASASNDLARRNSTEHLLPGSALLGSALRIYANSRQEVPRTVIGVLVAVDWSQCICYREGIAIAGSAYRNDDPANLHDAISSLAEHAGSDGKTGIFIVRLPGANVITPSTFPGYLDPVVIPAEELMKKINVNREKLFSPADKKKPIFRKALISAFVVLNLLLAGVRLDLTARMYEAEADALKRTYDARKKSSFEIIGLQKKRDALFANETAFPASASFDAYAVFDHLSKNLPRTTLDSFNFQGNAIKFTARSADALSCVSRLQADPFFSGMMLVQAVPDPSGGEIFTVSGRIER